MFDSMRITSYPRIHFALADLSHVSHRIYGGAGMAIDGFSTILEIKKSNSFLLSGFEKLDQQATLEIQKILDRLLPSSKQAGIHLNLIDHPPQHCGFGSKTTLLLSIIKIINAFFKLNLNRNDIQILSGRAGASGIGVHTFWDGGFIVDGGHKSVQENLFLPSSSQFVDTIPPVIFKNSWPKEWKVHLFLSKNGCTISGEEEKLFFQKNTPIKDLDSLKTIAAIYHGLIPAILEKDFCILKSSIEKINSTGFKKVEINSQNLDVFSLINFLNKSSDLVAGMSSMGPLVYCFQNNNSKDIAILKNCILEKKYNYLGEFEGNNSGFVLNG